MGSRSFPKRDGESDDTGALLRNFEDAVDINRTAHYNGNHFSKRIIEEVM